MCQKHYSFRGVPDLRRVFRENPDALAIYVASEHDSILLVRCPDAEKEAEQVCQRVLRQHGVSGVVSKLVRVRRVAKDGRPTVVFETSGCDPVCDYVPTGIAVHGLDRPDHPAIRQLIAEVSQIPTKPRVTVVAYGGNDAHISL